VVSVSSSSTDWFKNIERAMTDWNKQFAAGIAKPGKGSSISGLNGDIVPTPSEIIYTKDRVKLLHYTPITKKSLVPVPLLVVCALVNRYYIVDLQPDHSVIRRYLERGIDVYIIDWGDPAPSDRYETIGDEVDYIDEMVDVIRKRSGLKKVNLHGYCMGGTLCVIYASVHPEKIKSLVVQAAPIDFSTSDGIFNLWAKYLDTDQIVDTFGNVPGSFMNLGFLLVNPVRLLIDKYVKFYERIDDKEHAENFLRMEKWVFDTPDMPGESYRQFLNDLFQKNLLVKGELVVNDVKVSLKQLRAPLLSLVADNDVLVPPSSSVPLNELVSSRVKKIMRYPTGHVGLCVSKKTHTEFWPLVADWIAKNSVRHE
jgi:polyhydroxyalkanoate synthase subunit PhaC